MALSIDQITQQIINQLQLIDPAVSAEIGTPERKIIEATAEVIASSQVDFTVLNQQNDLDSMSGGRLDAYLGNFGFARQQAVAATGTVTFSRNSNATTDIVIPAGTQLSATVDNPAFPNLVFNTTQTVTLTSGTSSVDAPVQATTPGTVGNVGANAITGFTNFSGVNGITSVTNSAGMTGGEDAETDEELKVRFQNTIFRNMTGTYDQYMALAVALPNVSKANVIGAVSRYQEYVQVPATNDTAQATCDDTGAHDGTSTGYDPNPGNLIWPHKRTSAVSTNPYSQYTYDQNYYLTNGDLSPSAIFYKPLVDFVFNRHPVSTNSGSFQTLNTVSDAAHQPNVTFLKTAGTDAGANPDITPGTTLLLEHAYVSKHSRNNITLGITNAVDVYINGSDDQQASSQEIMPGAENKLQTTSINSWSYQNVSNPNFQRGLDGASCAVGSLIVPCFFQPVTTLPSSITIKNSTDNKTYTFFLGQVKSGGIYYSDATLTKRASYLYAKEVNGYYGTVRCRNGFEFLSGVNGYTINTNGTLVQGSRDALDAGFVGSQFKVTYTWDRNVGRAQSVMDQQKQITADVLVHRARLRYFSVNATIMYGINVTRAVVDASISTAISAFFDSQFYGVAIQLSDILQIIHNVPGVDNVRWTNDTNGSIPKVEEVQADGSFFASRAPHQYNTDFFLSDDTLAASPAANGVVITIKAQNTWGT